MANVFKAKLCMRYKGQGWNEEYVLRSEAAGSLADAIPIARQLAFGRTAFFGRGVELHYACVFNTDSAKRARLVPLPYPLKPHTSFVNSGATEGNIGDFLVEPNDVKVCIQMRLETALGQEAQRYYHGVPDSWVVDNELACGIGDYLETLVAGRSIPDFETSSANHKTICNGFWSYLIDKTAMHAKNGTGDKVSTPFGYVTFRKIASKKVGIPFGTSRGRRPKNLIS